jgi:hypothetical protein
MTTRQYKEFLGSNIFPNRFTFKANDSEVLYNRDASEFPMHVVTQQLQLTGGGSRPQMKHPFESLMVVEPTSTSPVVGSIERSRLMRK